MLRFAILLLLSPTLCLAAGSNITIKSQFDTGETAARYIGALEQAEVPILERRLLESGEEIVFPSPLYGTSIGRCHKGLRKDLPLSARIWEDEQGRVWLSYPRQTDVVNNFGVIECGNETDTVRRALSGFASSATEE